MILDLAGTPYSIESTGQGILDDVAELEERVALLRSEGTMSEATLRSYFGDKRFEQIAESNALEGSTLSTGETQLAVLRGITITGHDPAFSKDAVSLANALDRVVELARADGATDQDQLQAIHALILGDRPGAGVFRSEPVRISGSAHRPPKTLKEIMDAVEAWAAWSKANPSVPALLRGVVLHTWLTHIHPFIDGNGRTARAILNLELIRSGLPSVIIRRKDRERYLDALAESDAGGDLGPIAELIVERENDALRDLERAAKTHQGYDEASIRLGLSRSGNSPSGMMPRNCCSRFWRKRPSRHSARSGPSRPDGTTTTSCSTTSSPSARETLPGTPGSSALASACRRLVKPDTLPGPASEATSSSTPPASEPGPSIFWSVPDPTGYRQWDVDDSRSPGGAELTLKFRISTSGSFAGIR